MRGRFTLAAEESEGLLNTLKHSVDPFLCRVLRGEPAPWAALIPEVTPDDFLQRSEHHGVQALLFHQMHGREEWLNWPGGVRREIEESNKRGVARDLLHRHYLARVLEQFSRRRVRCLLMKGEALAVTHYPSPGTRPRSDSDLFIRICDISEARKAMLEAGFSVVSPIYKTHQFSVCRSRQGADAVNFDVHWRIQNHPRFARAISFDDAFERSMEAPGLEGARLLCDIDALQLACMHRLGSDGHDRDRLIWIHDIHVLASGMSPEDLKRFAASAVEREVQAACLDGLTRSKDCFLTEIPEELFATLDTAGTPRNRSRRLAESNMGLLIDDWKNLPDGQSRLALLKELLLPSSQYLLYKYDKSSKLWLPLLYLRQILGGAYNRLLLR